MTDRQTQRRIIGLLLGLEMGLIFGLVSQLGNRIALPDIPLYQPPLGPWGNIALLAMAGMAVGLLSAWRQGSLSSILIASVIAALGVIVVNVPSIRFTAKNWIGIIVSLLFLAPTIFGCIAPLVAALRLGTNKQEQMCTENAPLLKRVLIPLALLLVVGSAATLTLYSPQARVVLGRMNAMLQTALASTDASALPRPLQAEEVGGFRDKARGAYTLEWTFSDINRYAIARAPSKPGEESAVIARFQNGWRLVCVFTSDTAEPACKGFLNYR